MVDISWNNNTKWFIALAADNNLLKVWRLASDIYDEEDEEEEVGDEEIE